MSASTRVGHDVVSGHWKGHGRLSNVVPEPTLPPVVTLRGHYRGLPPPGLTWTPEFFPRIVPIGPQEQFGG